MICHVKDFDSCSLPTVSKLVPLVLVPGREGSEREQREMLRGIDQDEGRELRLMLMAGRESPVLALNAEKAGRSAFH